MMLEHERSRSGSAISHVRAHHSRSTRQSEYEADGDFDVSISGDQSHERQMRQLKTNWILVNLLCYYLYSGYSITFSTLHQFVTEPTNVTCGYPGLEESEVIYSLSAGLFSAGEILSSLMVITLMDIMGYMALFFMGVACQTVGFLIYGLSSAGWMVIVSRILLGVNSGIIISIPFSYIRKSVDEYNTLLEMSHKKRNEKLNNQLIFLTSIVTNCSFVVTLGIVLVVAQFPSVNQFRWVAWFEVSLGTSMIVLTMLFFRDPLPTFRCKKIKWKPSQLSKNSKKEGASKHISLGVIFAVVYLLATSYMLNTGYTVLDTLANPILSDYFGFTVEMQSYFFLGVTILVPFTCFIFVVVDRLSIDTRIILVVMLLLSTAGLVLLADWQTLSSTDQCHNFSIIETDSYTSHELACDAQSCSPFEVVYDDVCIGLNQTDSVDDILSSLSHIMLYSTADIGQFSTPMVNSHCPACADIPTVNCLNLAVSQGSICAGDNAASSAGSSAFLVISNSETSLCLTLNTSIFTAELNSSCQASLSMALLEEIISLPLIAALQSQQQCEDHSGDPYYCYWNQDSLITGQHCPDCPPLCRSSHKIPHFAQVFLSVSLMSVTAGAGLWVVRAIMVQISPVRIVAVFTGFYALVSALSKLLTPIWSNLVYVASGRHTIAPVAILLICQLPSYIGLFFLWKPMKRKTGDAESSSSEEHTGDAESSSSKEHTEECNLDNEDNESEFSLTETRV